MDACVRVCMCVQDERDSLLCIKDTLEQERKDMKAKQTGLEEELRVKQEDLGKTKVCVYVCCACIHVFGDGYLQLCMYVCITSS